MEWINAIVQGVLLGGYYSLIACGLAFMLQVMRIINLAHGSLAVLAGFALWTLAAHFAINPFLSLIGVLPAMALLGWLLQRGILERSTRSGELVPILATFGLAIVLDNLMFLRFSADPRSLSQYIGTLSYDSWSVGSSIYVGKLSFLIFVVAVALLGGLSLFLSRTHIGRAIRATAEDPDTVGLIGISARRVNAMAAAIALVTIGIAGAFLGMSGNFTPYSGATQLLFAFEATVIGGTGSLWGTLLGGIVLGIAQMIGAQVNPQAFLITGHVVFLVILVARVSGTLPSFATMAARLRRQQA
ncbi:MAG: branched-chain amino acid ABC transporter permease [Acidihalobacter sp.]